MQVHGIRMHAIQHTAHTMRHASSLTLTVCTSWSHAHHIYAQVVRKYALQPTKPTLIVKMAALCAAIWRYHYTQLVSRTLKQTWGKLLVEFAIVLRSRLG